MLIREFQGSTPGCCCRCRAGAEPGEGLVVVTIVVQGQGQGQAASLMASSPLSCRGRCRQCCQWCRRRCRAGAGEGAVVAAIVVQGQGQGQAVSSAGMDVLASSCWRGCGCIAAGLSRRSWRWLGCRCWSWLPHCPHLSLSLSLSKWWW